MGGAVPFIIFLVVGLVVLYFLMTSGAVALTGRRAGAAPVADEMEDDGPQPLRYAVPRGQDPATVIAALNREGFDAALDPEDSAGGKQVVLVAAPDGGQPDREQVRRVIGQQATLNFEGDRPDTGPVRFADEA